MVRVPPTKERLLRDLRSDMSNHLGALNERKAKAFRQKLTELEDRTGREKEALSKTADTRGPDDFNSSPYADKPFPESVLDSEIRKRWPQRWKEMEEFKETSISP